MSDYIKRSTVTEWLSPKHRKKQTPAGKKQRGKQLGGELISLQMSNKFHRMVGVQVLSLAAVELQHITAGQHFGSCNYSITT